MAPAVCIVLAPFTLHNKLKTLIAVTPPMHHALNAGHTQYCTILYTILLLNRKKSTFFKSATLVGHIPQVISTNGRPLLLFTCLIYSLLFSRPHESATSPVPLAGIAATFIILKTLILYYYTLYPRLSS